MDSNVIVRKVLFLDIDGVMIPKRAHLLKNDQTSNIKYEYPLNIAEKFDPIAVAMIKDVILKTYAKIVISSSWAPIFKKDGISELFKDNKMNPDWLHEDYSTPRSAKSIRVKEIGDWLSNHPEVEKYCAIDDDSTFHPEIAKAYANPNNLIMVSFEDGILYEDYINMMRILS